MMKFAFVLFCFYAFTTRSPQWAYVREIHLRAHPECEACGTRLDLDVHHVLPFAQYPECELVMTNLITLCRFHHFTVGHDPDGAGPRRPNWQTANPNVREDASALRVITFVRSCRHPLSATRSHALTGRGLASMRSLSRRSLRPAPVLRHESSGIVPPPPCRRHASACPLLGIAD